MTRRTETAELAGALRPVILRLGRRLRQMQDASVELTASQSSVLFVLLGGEITMGELAAAEKVQPPTVTRLVKGLEERGLVERSVAAADGRQSLVALTDAGRTLLMANRQVRNEWLSERLDELDPVERRLLRQVIPILAKVNHA